MHHVASGATIRPAVAEDIPAIAALWCDAFPSRRTVADRVRMLETGGRYGGLETVLVARSDEGSLLAACKLYRMTQWITGVAMPMMGLAAVAVQPEARQRGLGSRLCAHALGVARDRGDVVSALYPFRPDYYERLGWGFAGELHEYRFRTADLPTDYGASSVRPASGAADAAGVAACYGRVASRSTGLIERDARIWAWRLADDEVGVAPSRPRGQRPAGRILVVHDPGGIDGYALLRHRRDRVDVRELVVESEVAYRAIIGYLAANAGRWPNGRHTARPEERFGDRLLDPRWSGAGRVRSLHFPTARLVRGPMVRVLDARLALAMRRYFDASAPGAPTAVTIDILLADRHLEASSGRWRVRIEGGSGHVETAAGGHADAAIETDASVFARIFAGDLSPSDAGRLGRAVLRGDAALVDAAFATRKRFWLLDEF